MTLTTQEYRALIDAIAAAPSLDALSALRSEVRREHGFDIQGGFVEVLLELRLVKLARMTPDPARARIA